MGSPLFLRSCSKRRLVPVRVVPGRSLAETLTSSAINDAAFAGWAVTGAGVVTVPVTVHDDRVRCLACRVRADYGGVREEAGMMPDCTPQYR
jgi:hypothetical protein